jgi:hypothetical protein
MFHNRRAQILRKTKLDFISPSLNQMEREQAEMAAGAAAKAEKEAYFSSLPGKIAAGKAARLQKKADKKGEI